MIERNEIIDERKVHRVYLWRKCRAKSWMFSKRSLFTVAENARGVSLFAFWITIMKIKHFQFLFHWSPVIKLYPILVWFTQMVLDFASSFEYGTIGFDEIDATIIYHSTSRCSRSTCCAHVLSFSALISWNECNKQQK